MAYDDALIEITHSDGSRVLDVVNHLHQLFSRLDFLQRSVGNRLELLTQTAAAATTIRQRGIRTLKMGFLSSHTVFRLRVRKTSIRPN